MHVRAGILLLSVMDGGTEPFTGDSCQAGVNVELEATAAPWLTWWGWFECSRAKGGNPMAGAGLLCFLQGSAHPFLLHMNVTNGKNRLQDTVRMETHHEKGKNHAASPYGMGAALQHGRAAPSDCTTQADPSAC